MKLHKYQQHPKKNNWRIVYMNNTQCLDLRLFLLHALKVRFLQMILANAI
jgi:hypothetical protein